jgi:hypothetical protein
MRFAGGSPPIASHAMTKFVPKIFRPYWYGIGLIGLMTCVFLLGSALSFGAAKKTIDLSNYRLTFDETFSTLDVSAYGPNSRWIAHTPWNGDFGDAIFDNPGPGGPFTLTPNGLNITAYQDAKKQWHSGLLCSKSAQGVGPRGFAQTYGYFEMRAKLPSGPGVWPAFWLVGTLASGPAPELDVIEFYGAFPGYFRSTEHIWENNKDHLHDGHLVTVPEGILSRQFNTFGILIEPQTTTYYFNRVAYWSTPTLPAFRQPMAIIVNLALGGGWPINELRSPRVMEIQYIRAFEKK